MKSDSTASFLLLGLVHVIVFWALNAWAGQSVPTVDLSVAITPQEVLEGRADIHCKSPVEVDTAGLQALEVPFLPKRQGILYIDKEACKKEVVIRFKRPLGKIQQNIDLINAWYPRILGLSRYNLSVRCPKGLVPVSEGDHIIIEGAGREKVYNFIFPYPRKEVTLAIGRYIRKSKDINGIKIDTFFFPEDQHLSDLYIERAGRFIKALEKRLGPYPFKRFAIVEDSLPTGYGMATMTLIGKAILPRSFVIEESLGHEIAHSWFGDSVYVNAAYGNWCEGLVTYIADHAFKEEKGLGADYRHDILIDYQSYVHNDNVMTLSAFRSRKGRATKAIGYGKGAFFFHMLRRRLGDGLFYRGLKIIARDLSFKEVSWKDIQEVFQEISKEDLEGFFNQWLKRTTIPRLRIEGAKTEGTNSGGFLVGFDIVQEATPPYTLDLPVEVKTAIKNVRRVITIKGKRTHVEIETKAPPLELVLDPDFDVMRRLSSPEFPPVISRLLGDERKVFVVDESGNNLFKDTEAILFGMGFKKVDPRHLTRDVIRNSSILFLGRPPEGRVKSPSSRHQGSFKDGGASIQVMKNPSNQQGVIAVLSSASPEDSASLIRKIPHYGRYSYLRLEGGTVIQKKKKEGQKGIKVILEMPTMGISTKDLRPLSFIIDKVSGARVIFIGEQHDQYSHHLAQLDIIKGLFQRGYKIAVGMEMFQRPFQKALDQFIQGTISEKEFLKRSEYFSRWNYDYVLYRPILQFCRKNRIPVIALNIKEEISKKVARKGINALTKDEKRLIPVFIDLDNEAYKNRLREIFRAHPKNALKNFDYFYQAQVLWDETMAETISNYLGGHPGTKMVVLAGIGHVAYGYGIPSRVKRRIDVKTAIVAATGDVQDPAMADYLLFPAYRPKPFSARLGVLIDTTPGHPLTIEKVMPYSPADVAGLKSGDIILKMDGERVASIEDLKIDLLEKSLGDTCTLTIKRRRRFMRDIVKSIRVGPFKEIMYHRHRLLHRG